MDRMITRRATPAADTMRAMRPVVVSYHAASSVTHTKQNFGVLLTWSYNLSKHFRKLNNKIQLERNLNDS